MKKHLFALTALIVFADYVSNAQVVLTGTNYVQDFNGIGSGLPTGWSVRTGASASNLGTAATFNANHKDWGSTTGSFANYASTTNTDGTVYTGSEPASTQTNSVTLNRALGVRQTGAFGDPGAAFVLQLQDTAGLGNFQLKVDMNMLSVQTRSTVWTIDYSIGNTPAIFTSLGTFADPGVFGTTVKTFSLGTALDNQGQNVWIRVVALGATTGSSNRDTFAVDNFSLTYNAVANTTNPPSITTRPANLTNNASSTAVFTAVVSGTGPLGFQWKKDNNDLFDGPTASGSVVFGATTASLTITNVFAPDAGTYTIVVTNSVGTATTNATLTVIDPAVTFGASNRTNLVGDTGLFRVTAAGSPPVTYQWKKGVSNVPNGNASILGVTNAQIVDAGTYTVFVTSPFGTATNSATLTVYPRPSQRIAQWNFNATTQYPVTAPLPSVSDNIAASLLGGATAAFVAGTDSDPAALDGANANFAWNTSTYPAQGLENKTRGAQFNVSTLGYQKIFMAWEQRNTATASKYTRLQYSTDGTTFVDGPVINMTLTNSSFLLVTNDLSSISALNNNSNVVFRIVSEIEISALGSGSTNYIATVPGSTYGTGGTIRYDWLNVYGEPYVDAPVLSVQSTNTSVNITWPVGFNGYVLQSNLNLGSTNWQAVIETTNVVNNSNTVVIPAIGTKFLRLIK
ncbi:MAG: type sorting protein [Verrucomicrobiales bacterium]|nr:type sorting protein [Verrucomicrobiales bacterium]